MKLCTPNVAMCAKEKLLLWELQFFLEVVQPKVVHGISRCRSRMFNMSALFCEYKNDHSGPKISGDRLELVSTFSGGIYKALLLYL